LGELRRRKKLLRPEGQIDRWCEGEEESFEGKKRKPRQVVEEELGATGVKVRLSEHVRVVDFGLQGWRWKI